MSFTYSNESNTFSGPSTLTVHIREGMVRKAELLEELAAQLRFPWYFGQNWDALDECLQDFHWMDYDRIVLVHHDLPLQDQATEMRTYLEILRDACDFWAARSRPVFVVVFPPSWKHLIEATLNTIG